MKGGLIETLLVISSIAFSAATGSLGINGTIKNALGEPILWYIGTRHGLSLGNFRQSQTAQLISLGRNWLYFQTTQPTIHKIE